MPAGDADRRCGLRATAGVPGNRNVWELKGELGWGGAGHVPKRPGLVAAPGAPAPLVRGGVRKAVRDSRSIGFDGPDKSGPFEFLGERPWTRHLSSSVLFRPLLLLPPLGAPRHPSALLARGSPGCRPGAAASARKKLARTERGSPGAPGGDRKDRESCPHTGIPSPPASALGRRRATGQDRLLGLRWGATGCA